MEPVTHITHSTCSTLSQAVKERTAAIPSDTNGKAEPNLDKVTFSPEELEKNRVQAAKKKLQEMEAEQKRLREQFENAKEQAEALSKAYEVEGKCLTIAMRIISGDTVPQQDYRYLAKNNSELYARAITLRIERDDPRKQKRVSEDEEPDDAAAETEATLEADIDTPSDTADTDQPAAEAAATESAPATLSARA